MKCPNCGEETKGDQCDCGYVPTKKDLEKAICIECGSMTTTKENKNLYLQLPEVVSDKKIKKKDRKLYYGQRAIDTMKEFIEACKIKI